jgi:hypothetical protein
MTPSVRASSSMPRAGGSGYTLEGDKKLQSLFGSGFLIPRFPQTVLEEVGSVYSLVAPDAPYVVRDGQLVTGQNQQSASEYALVLLHAMTGQNPCRRAEPQSQKDWR